MPHKNPFPESRINNCLFPENPRDFPYRRALKTSLRTLHIFAAGTFLGGHIFAVSSTQLEPWLWATVLSGLLITMTDLHASFAVLGELRGIAVLVKLLLVLAVPVFWDARVALLIAALVIGAVISHMPGRYRHIQVFLRDRVVADNRKG